MSVDQQNTIDFISTTPDGSVSLTISDHLSWEEANHFDLLQNKIDGYLQFIQSGQILTDYPSALGKKITIDAVLKFQPDEHAIHFLTKTNRVLKEKNINFKWRILFATD